MNLKQLSGIVIAAASIFWAGRMTAALPAAQPLPQNATVYGIADSANGTPYLVALGTPVAIGTATPTLRPSPTAVQPSATATPRVVEVTPIGGTPTYPRTVKSEREYVPLVNLIVRTSPERTSTNGTTDRATAGTPYMIYHIREYADGSAWGCLTDSSDWRACVRWIAIKADLSPVDGVLEEYARATEGPVE